MGENDYFVLDGPLEEQIKAAKRSMTDLSDEDNKRAMSSEFDYLDDEQ